MPRIKTLAIIAASYSAGEFVNEFRQQKTPISFIDFTKKYVKENVAIFRHGMDAIGVRNGEFSTAAYREDMKKLMFPHRIK